MALSTSSAVDMVLFSSFTLIRRPNALGVKLRLAATEAHTDTPPPTARCQLQLLVGLTPTDAACDALFRRALWRLYWVTATPSRQRQALAALPATAPRACPRGAAPLCAPPT